MSANILITGATGTIGSQVVKQLSEQGVAVKAAAYSPNKAESLQLPHVEVVKFDFNDQKLIHDALEGVQKLFLLTPFAPDQVKMAKTLIAEAQKSDVRHIVKLSVLGADSEQAIQTGKWHKQAEDAIIGSQIPHTFLRPNSFAENYINYFGATIKSESKIYLPQGKGKQSLIDSKDIAAVATKILMEGGQHQGKIYELERLDQAILDVINNPKGVQKTAHIGTLI